MDGSELTPEDLRMDQGKIFGRKGALRRPLPFVGLNRRKSIVSCEELDKDVVSLRLREDVSEVNLARQEDEHEHETLPGRKMSTNTRRAT